MRVISARYFTPLLVLVVLAVVLVPVSASLFNLPKLDFDRFSFGTGADQQSAMTIVDKSMSPFADISASSGIGMPFDGWSGMFRSPVTSRQSYTRTVTTPEGPKTQTVSRSYDGTTGERTTTVANA